MANKKAPCGTVTAYNRHRRNGEDPCAECKRAKSEDKTARNEAKRAEAAATVDRSANKAYEDMTRLEVLKELRRRLFQHMDEAAPQNVSQIASQLRLVAAEIDEIEGNAEEKAEFKSPESVFDEVSQMRSKKAG